MIDSLLGGGAERVAIEAAGALDPDRYLPHLLVTRHSGPLQRLVQDAAIECTVLGRRGTVDLGAFRRACAIVRSSDLLHAHKFEGAMLGALIARATGRPMVAHEHTFNGRPSARGKLAYRHLIAPAASRIVCVAPSIAESLVAYGVSRDLVRVIPNGVPTAAALERETARAELQLGSAQVVIGIIGRLRPEKRHDLALEALALLRRGGRDVSLCCVGDGPRRDELRALGVTLGVSDHVEWAGERPNAGRLVRAFDVMVLCSDFEGMPLAALEALVAGVPLVATAVGSLPELVAQGGGRVVPPGDAQALADAVAAELDEFDPVRNDRASASARVLFGLERSAIALQGVYDEVFAADR
jgi:glycosyltransferase involved in cell wall biosynthesis